jgi:hypothetical protein
MSTRKARVRRQKLQMGKVRDGVGSVGAIGLLFGI